MNFWFSYFAAVVGAREFFSIKNFYLEILKKINNKSGTENVITSTFPGSEGCAILNVTSL
jgi:hypothetical protein